jgi:hypothetical protein
VSSSTKSVMLSASSRDFREQREIVRQAITAHGMLPVVSDMASDSLWDRKMITESLARIDEASVFIALIGQKYAQEFRDPILNPDGLSYTELEYRRARERGIPIFTFLIDETSSIPRSGPPINRAQTRKFRSFLGRARQQSRAVETVASLHELRSKADEILSHLSMWSPIAEVPARTSARPEPSGDLMGDALAAGFSAAVQRAVRDAHDDGLAVPARVDGVAVEIRPDGEVVPIDDEALWSPTDWRRAASR